MIDPFEYRQGMMAFALRGKAAALIMVDLQYGSTDPAIGWQRAYRMLGAEDVVSAHTRRVDSVIVPNAQLLLDAFRKRRAFVTYLVVGSVRGDFSDLSPQKQRTCQYFESRGIPRPIGILGGREMEIISAIKPLPSEPVLPKSTNSAFTSTALDGILREKQKTQLVFCGVATNACVGLTVRDAVDRGYDCVVVEDACGAVTRALHVAELELLRTICRVETTDVVLSELEERMPAPT